MVIRIFVSNLFFNKNEWVKVPDILFKPFLSCMTIYETKVAITGISLLNMKDDTIFHKLVEEN